MKLRKEFFVILYVFILLLNDPQIMRAATITANRSVAGPLFGSNAVIDPFMGLSSDKIHLVYELNDGINSNYNPVELDWSELPVTLDVPVRDGYNFAGWYTDSRFQNKITEINQENAGNMVLFAKWTEAIDNHYNVEMYSYKTSSLFSYRQKELKNCNYDFLDYIDIPGMPSTREQDYLDNVILSEGQCLQGLCFTPDLILMTSYAEDSKTPGSLLVFDRESGKYLVTLGMKKESHLGGIAFDGENVWVCHSATRTLERIPYEHILNIAKDAPGCYVDASALTDEYRIKNTPSCITCYGGRIWVASHSKMFNSQMRSYSYDERNDTLTSLASYTIPSKVQGVAFDKDGSVYFSTSYGRNNSSYLKVYASLLTLKQAPNAPTMKVEMPPCSEEIAIADGNVYVIFESASRKYLEGTDGNGKSASPLDQVLEVTVASIW